MTLRPEADLDALIGDSKRLKLVLSLHFKRVKVLQ